MHIWATGYSPQQPTQSFFNFYHYISIGHFCAVPYIAKVTCSACNNNGPSWRIMIDWWGQCSRKWLFYRGNLHMLTQMKIILLVSIYIYIYCLEWLLVWTIKRPMVYRDTLYIYIYVYMNSFTIEYMKWLISTQYTAIPHSNSMDEDTLKSSTKSISQLQYCTSAYIVKSMAKGARNQNMVYGPHICSTTNHTEHKVNMCTPQSRHNNVDFTNSSLQATPKDESQ